MIQVIGIKRFLILMVLICANGALAASLYMYTIPEKANTERRLSLLRGQVNTIQSDIDRMQIEFDQLDQQQALFDELEEKGFFSNQVRSEAKELFSKIQDESKVISAVVSVKSGLVVDDKEAQKANHKILLSPVEIAIQSFDDGSIYDYISLVQEQLPGHLSLDEITMQRLQDVNAPVLRAIASGASTPLVGAKVKMSWRTIIPESQIILDKDG